MKFFKLEITAKSHSIYSNWHDSLYIDILILIKKTVFPSWYRYCFLMQHGKDSIVMIKKTHGFDIQKNKESVLLKNKGISYSRIKNRAYPQRAL